MLQSNGKKVVCWREQACCASLTLLPKLLNPLLLCVCGFGNLRPIVCPICNGDEEMCPLALRQPRGVNRYQRHKREETFLQHLGEGWARLGGFANRSPPLSLLLKRRVTGREGQRQDSPLSNTSVFMLRCLFPLCGLSCFVCQAEGVFPSSLPAPC